MSKPPIKYEKIQIIELWDDIHDDLYNYSQNQRADKHYSKLRQYLTDFYNTQLIDRELYWSESHDTPITIEFLHFIQLRCDDCNEMLEIPVFGGQMKIRGVSRTYKCFAVKERWCDSQQIKENSFSFDFQIESELTTEKTPLIFYWRDYINLNNFIINYGNDQLELHQKAIGVFLQRGVYCLSAEESIGLHIYNIETKCRDGMWGLISDIYLLTPRCLSNVAFWSNPENANLIKILDDHPQLLASNHSDLADYIKQLRQENTRIQQLISDQLKNSQRTNIMAEPSGLPDAYGSLEASLGDADSNKPVMNHRRNDATEHQFHRALAQMHKCDVRAITTRETEYWKYYEINGKVIFKDKKCQS